MVVLCIFFLWVLQPITKIWHEAGRLFHRISKYGTNREKLLFSFSQEVVNIGNLLKLVKQLKQKCVMQKIVKSLIINI